MIDLVAFSVANPGLVVGSVAAGAAARQPYGSLTVRIAGTMAAGLVALYGTGALLSPGVLS